MVNIFRALAFVLASTLVVLADDEGRFEMKLEMNLSNGNLTECPKKEAKEIRDLLHESIETHARYYLNELGLDGDDGFDLDYLFEDHETRNRRRLGSSSMGKFVLIGNGIMTIYPVFEPRRRLKEYDEGGDDDDMEQGEYKEEYDEYYEEYDEEYDGEYAEDENEEDEKTDEGGNGQAVDREAMEEYLSEKVTEDINSYASFMTGKHGHKTCIGAGSGDIKMKFTFEKSGAKF
mmetsp:Transcript_37777/g.53287  ORF Transcript_37777/g.53287 Transcript_37777/m.53287 type:complete len:233 (+) Transcript_37777:58-756(+)